MCYGKVSGVCVIRRSVVYMLKEDLWCMCYCKVCGVRVMGRIVVHVLL